MQLPIALSPCPNDTFLFHAWIERKIESSLIAEPHFADIQQLNEWALEGKFPLIKISFNCFKEVMEQYRLLSIGAALGFNCGPKIVATESFELDEMKRKRVAIPGKMTTAHLLLEQFVGRVGEKVFCQYHEIGHLLKTGEVDCGVIIHESRFTFAKDGFIEIADLGVLWHNRTSLPLPLGCVVIKRDLPESATREVLRAMHRSLEFAKKNPSESQGFGQRLSQEKEKRVIEAHIATYVNKETECLSPEGIKAISTLIGCDEEKISPHFCDKS